jgi:predicted ribosomally synthesized peptide with nif11-like leader
VPIQDALAFLRQARHDEGLVREVEAMDDEVTWESLAEIAGRAGFRFTPEELQRAHALDWKMRWARYRGQSGGREDSAHAASADFAD